MPDPPVPDTDDELERLEAAVERLREAAERLRATDIADAEIAPLAEEMLAISREVGEGLADVLRASDR